ncbi:MAG TPA: SRPBCC domain-containing protein [Caldilineaceae bacterium]|nr:SRPBCC domain-containing protein [Caldilineaceae bacterium]
MSTTKSPVAAKSGQEVVISRVFDAPRELVFRAWTDPERIMQWWGPAHFTSPACKVDFRVGGAYLFCMRSPDGQDFWSTGTYKEITPPERIVYTDSFADAQGNVVSAAHYGMPGDWPAELLVTITFEDQAGKTKLTLRQTGIPAGEVLEMTAAGWNESLDKLAESLKN